MKQMFSLRDKFTFILSKSLFLIISLCLILSSCSSANNPLHEPMKGVERDTSTTETIETEPPKPEIPKKNITVCVDPGHGFEAFNL